MTNDTPSVICSHNGIDKEANAEAHFVDFLLPSVALDAASASATDRLRCSVEGFAATLRTCREGGQQFDLVVLGHSIPREDREAIIRVLPSN